ncbi:HoxN/HupN/NixA family nickel/cobalt transporter [Paucilactobacillus nenjiangensis]|nr:HoxN/HupN/NixA family nickel/cobalt transporter [Paucilactobacillus nenjiangensis]
MIGKVGDFLQRAHYPLVPDLIKYYGFVSVLFFSGIALTLAFMSKYPSLLTMAFLSFTLGLQHAFDIDHVTVIDNITRKMVNDNQNTHGIGFSFSFGHSLVVILMSILTILFVEWSKEIMPSLENVGSIIGSSFAGLTLILLALINLHILIGIWRNFKSVNKNLKEVQFDKSWVYKRFDKLLHLINHNWQVVLIGFVFGLGLDTATQISVLATSAVSTSQGVPWYAVLSFPLLFTSGMCLMDTSDGIFMSTAYSWVFSSPIRKVYYNLILTGLSVLAAIFSGIVNLSIATKLIFHSTNNWFIWIENLNFFYLGITLVAVFIVIWILAIAGWYYFGLDKKEEIVNLK